MPSHLRKAEPRAEEIFTWLAGSFGFWSLDQTGNKTPEFLPAGNKDEKDEKSRVRFTRLHRRRRRLSFLTQYTQLKSRFTELQPF